MSTTFTPDRQTFRALVADVAARAKARLPETVNGRVESAVKLVLLHDVLPQEDGSILVGSSTDPMKTYLLQGDTCECQDWQHGKAPQGWCMHRIAAGIHKRVGEVLAAQTSTPPPVELPEDLEVWPDNDLLEAPSAPQPAPLPEAPASVNVRVTIGGRECQLTLRDSDEGRLLQRLEAVLERFPVEAPPQPQASREPAPEKRYCPLHGSELRWNEGKDGRKGWFSHKTADGWCRGK